MSHIPPKRLKQYSEYRIPPLMDLRDLYGQGQRRRKLVPKKRLGSRDPLSRS